MLKRVGKKPAREHFVVMGNSISQSKDNDNNKNNNNEDNNDDTLSMMTMTLLRVRCCPKQAAMF